MSQENVKLISMALFEMKLLLSSYLGSENEGALEIRAAAHLAYALHNEAAALANGEEFDTEEALKKVAAIEAILPEGSFAKFVAQYRSGGI